MQLAFYKARRGGLDGLFDAAVRWLTDGPYSHVELVMTDGTWWTSSNRDGGVRAKQIDLDPARWDLVTVTGDEAAISAWFSRLAGLKYDFLGLFGFVVRPTRGKRNRWFCSEACAAALGYREPERFCPNLLAIVAGGPRIGQVA